VKPSLATICEVGLTLIVPFLSLLPNLQIEHSVILRLSTRRMYIRGKGQKLSQQQDHIWLPLR
jgi:hypothetical protein